MDLYDYSMEADVILWITGRRYSLNNGNFIFSTNTFWYCINFCCIIVNYKEHLNTTGKNRTNIPLSNDANSTKQLITLIIYCRVAYYCMQYHHGIWIEWSITDLVKLNIIRICYDIIASSILLHKWFLRKINLIIKIYRTIGSFGPLVLYKNKSIITPIVILKKWPLNHKLVEID